MNNNWIDEFEKEKQARQKASIEHATNIQRQAKRLGNSGLAAKIKEVCDEANRRTDLNMQYNVETSNAGVHKIEVIRGSRYLIINVSESGIFLGCSYTGPPPYNDTFCYNVEIEPDKCSDEDIHECFKHMLGKERNKPTLSCLTYAQKSKDFREKLRRGIIYAISLGFALDFVLFLLSLGPGSMLAEKYNDDTWMLRIGLIVASIGFIIGSLSGFSAGFRKK